MSTDFRTSAAMMAGRLRILKRLQQQNREMGNRSITLHVDELFEPGDQEALETYERELVLHSGARPLFPAEG